MKCSIKKKVTTMTCVACVSLLMAGCGSEVPDQAAVEDALQESTQAAGEAIGGAAADAEEFIESQAGAIERGMDAVGERVEQPASFEGAADQIEGAADAAGIQQDLERTLDDAKKRLDRAQKEIEGAQE